MVQLILWRQNQPAGSVLPASIKLAQPGMAEKAWHLSDVACIAVLIPLNKR